MRAQLKCPKAIPGYFQDHAVWCEVICDWALNQMLFQRVFIHVGSSHMTKYNKSIVVRFRSVMVSGFVLSLPPRGGLKVVQVTMKHDPCDAM